MEKSEYEKTEMSNVYSFDIFKELCEFLRENTEDPFPEESILEDFSEGKIHFNENCPENPDYRISAEFTHSGEVEIFIN